MEANNLNHFLEWDKYDVAEWISSLNVSREYCLCFIEKDIKGSDLRSVASVVELQRIGIDKLGPRIKIKAAIERLLRFTAD